MARIAFLGLGRMGSGMARRLIAHGHEVSGWNRTHAKAEWLAAAGGHRCASPAEACRDAAVIVSMVSDDEASRATWMGKEGAFAGQPTTGALAIECSTLSHAWMLEFTAACRARGLRPIDAPVTGLPDAAASGTLTLLVGADPGPLEAARPILGAMSTTLHHFGPPGSGTAYKLLVNLIGAIQIASAAECLAIAERAGLDLRQVAGALTTGQAASPQVIRHVQRIIDPETARDITFTSALRLKDARYAIGLIRSLGVESSLGNASVGLYETLCDMGHAGDSESRIVEVFRRNCLAAAIRGAPAAAR